MMLKLPMTLPKQLWSVARQIRTMSSGSPSIYFGPFDVTNQVFHSTPLSFAVVNLKPLLPGHVLVSPRRPVRRLTDLSPDEVTDLFGVVQRVQRMLASTYFSNPQPEHAGNVEDGSFNIAIQDGKDAGQSVPHLHCHIIPRQKGNKNGDDIYDRLASEEGNLGGALWDRDCRPRGGGNFSKIEDEDRKPRSAEEMAKEADFFRSQMKILAD